MKRTVIVSAALIISAVCSTVIFGEEVPFDSERWVLARAVKTEYLGREAIAGQAWLDGVDFVNGVIEVDVAVDGRRSYPGIIFRKSSEKDYERYYFRPHRTCGGYPDVHQYTPTINGISGWQLYNGPGATSGGDVPRDEWVHLRLEVKGSQARVFLGDMDKPSLVIYNLAFGESRGTIGISGPNDGSAYFSRFSYRHDDNLEFDPPPRDYPKPGIIEQWELAGSWGFNSIDIEKYLDDQKVGELDWVGARCEPSGIVDVSRYFGRSGREPDVVAARTTLISDRKRTMKMAFGYSDLVSVFLNGRLLYVGNSAYRSRDRSFLGIVGLNDYLHLPLKKGKNELLMMVTESFGGWGFIVQDADEIYKAEGVEEHWESGREFKIPESALYDPERKTVYISNFDQYSFAPGAGGQSISRISPDGETIEHDWISGLSNPTGLALSRGRLYALERKALVEIDPDAGEVVGRYPLLTAGFLNDLAAAPDGMIFISDSRTGTIYLFQDGQFEAWLTGPEISQPNGLHVDRGNLLIGNNGDGTVKSVDLQSKKVKTVAELGQGIIDGIESDGEKGLLVSHWEGRLLRIDVNGVVTRLIDSTAPGSNIANFGFDMESGTVFIPTFMNNTVKSYRVFEQ